MASRFDNNLQRLAGPTDTALAAEADPRNHWLSPWSAALLAIFLLGVAVLGMVTSWWPLVPIGLFGFICVPYIRWKGKPRG
jgi:hypothetical protein